MREVPHRAGNTYLVTAFATPATLKSGTTTTLIIGITNVSDKAQTFDQNFCGPAYRITPPPGVQLSAQTLPASPTTIFRTLQPGEQAVYAAEWTTVHLDSLGHVTGPLPAGTYTVRGALDGSNVNSIPFTVQLTP